MTLAATAPAATRRALTAPEAALLKAVDLSVLAVTAVGGIVTLITAVTAGSDVASGIAASVVLTTAFIWVTRVAMQRASAGPAEALGTWILVSYAAKFVLILVGITLASKDQHISRAAFGLTLVAGIVTNVALQALLWRPGKTDTVQPIVTVPHESFDDDLAVAGARAANSRASVKVPPQ